MTTSWTSERGQSLVMALGILVVLGITVGGMVSFTTANSRSASMSDGRLSARVYAESGVHDTIGVLAGRITAGKDPSAANVLGCAGATSPTDTNGPSNCTTPAPLLFCLDGSATCTAGRAGTVSVYGYYSGTNAHTFLARAVPAASWLIVSTGTANNTATGGVTSYTSYALVAVQPMTSGNVASVWNHIFITSPLVPGQCALDWSGNNISANVPVYVIGNLCLGGSTINEGAQPVNVMVGGYLYLSGGGGIGTSAAISSGVVVGGCSGSKNGSGATSCTNGLWSYHVKAPDTFLPRAAPEETPADIQNDYATFDPGPAHPCAAGLNPYAPLPSTVFDGNGIYDNSAGTFTVTPGFNYTCNSTRGASVGQLQWNNGTKVLTINGSVFVDGNLVLNQSLTYSGVGVIEASGTITISGNATKVCAVANCDFNVWQDKSGTHNQMLTLASLAANTTAITFDWNSQTFQGSLWTQPSSSLTFVKNGDNVQGPMSIGKFDSTFNNATLQPLPVIKNMPVGAPVPPNTGVTLGVPVYVP